MRASRMPFGVFQFLRRAEHADRPWEVDAAACESEVTVLAWVDAIGVAASAVILAFAGLAGVLVGDQRRHSPVDGPNLSLHQGDIYVLAQGLAVCGILRQKQGAQCSHRGCGPCLVKDHVLAQLDGFPVGQPSPKHLSAHTVEDDVGPPVSKIGARLAEIRDRSHYEIGVGGL